MAEVQEKKSSTDVLAEILLKREMKEEQEKLDKEAKYAEKNKKRIAQDAQTIKNLNRQYANCDHLQGNHKNGEIPFKEVTHMSLHTFQDNTKRIRCNKCGFKWFPGDTAEVIKRDGVKQDNPTGIGWKEAYKTCLRYKNVGNKPSCGFITVEVKVPETQEE